MITKAQIRQVLDANIPGPYVHFQRRDFIADLILELIKKDASNVPVEAPKVIGKKLD
jgi:hypothetical protein